MLLRMISLYGGGANALYPPRRGPHSTPIIPRAVDVACFFVGIKRVDLFACDDCVKWWHSTVDEKFLAAAGEVFNCN